MIMDFISRLSNYLKNYRTALIPNNYNFQIQITKTYDNVDLLQIDALYRAVGKLNGLQILILHKQIKIL